MGAQGWGWNPDSVTAAAACVYTLLTAVLIVGVFIAFKQLRNTADQLKSAERSRRTELLFRIWEKYEDDKFYKATRILFSKQFSNLEEFERAFSNKEELEQAHLARREIKLTLAPLGYLLRFELIEPEQLFPVLPSAIELWGAGLRKVEEDLLEGLRNKRGRTVGYKDEVIGLMEYLFNKYQSHLQKRGVA